MKDCRKGKNKESVSCRVKGFCNKKENVLSVAGKTALSVIHPVAGIAVASYDIGKSALCDLRGRMNR